MEMNKIKLQSSAVKVEDNYLFINNKKNDYEEFYVVDNNKEADRIISSSSMWRFIFIIDQKVLLISSDLDDFEEQLNLSEENFLTMIQEISTYAEEYFQVATVRWTQAGQGLYYIKKIKKDYQSLEIHRDEWCSAQHFIDLAKEYEYDMDDDSFYDYDEESGKSKEDELNDEIYNQLCSDATLLAPEWF